jgi:hypothetical protein
MQPGFITETVGIVCRSAAAVREVGSLIGMAGSRADGEVSMKNGPEYLSSIS